MENSTNVSPSVVNLSGDHVNEVKGIKENENEKVEEPKVNLKFVSIKEAKDYYIRYASHMGFEITRRTSKRNLDDEVNFVAFVCKRYGSSVSTSQNPLKPQPVGKTNCEAKMNIVLCKNNEWRVSHYIPHHNHPLASPSQVRYFPCNRVIKPHVKRKLEINDKAGIRMNKSYNFLMVEAGGYENLTFLEKDCRNYVEEVRRLELGEGDAIAVQNYFMKMQARNSNFFYSMDMDDDGRLQNIFWADGRSREAYKEFGDVVTFDTTYLTNTYGMPFAPFVGVNHHGQSILLGCGLISGETTMMFVWLFKTWLACMSDCPPQAIITDQDRAMRNAIEIVFPNARHRWCLWHIMKKLPEKLSGYTDYKLIKISLKSVVYDSLSPTEFEVNWTQMIKKYGLHKNVWLGELYDDKHRWVPAFVKDCFWAGMSTTQRSEGMNSFFDKYIHPKTTLKQFVDQYENALKDKAEKESLANFNSFNSRLPCVTHYKMEEQFQKVYTIAKFKEFQLELTGKMYCEISSFKENATIANYEVYEDVKVGEGSKRVIFQVFLNKLYSNEEHEVNCNCRLFEFRGILCRHAILVLIHKKIFKVLNKYIIPRWRKDIKRQYTRVITSYDDWTSKPEGKRFDKMCNAFHGIADLAIDSEKKCNMVVDWIKDLERKLLMTEDNVDSYQPIQVSNLNEICASDGKCLVKDSRKPIDPVKVRSKGRPPTNRKQSKVEHIVNKKNKSKNMATKGQTDPVNNNTIGSNTDSTIGKFYNGLEMMRGRLGSGVAIGREFVQPSQIVGFTYGNGIVNISTPTFQVASPNMKPYSRTEPVPDQNASTGSDHDGHQGN